MASYLGAIFFWAARPAGRLPGQAEPLDLRPVARGAGVQPDPDRDAVRHLGGDHRRPARPEQPVGRAVHHGPGAVRVLDRGADLPRPRGQRGQPQRLLRNPRLALRDGAAVDAAAVRSRGPAGLTPCGVPGSHPREDARTRRRGLRWPYGQSAGAVVVAALAGAGRDLRRAPDRLHRLRRLRRGPPAAGQRPDPRDLTGGAHAHGRAAPGRGRQAWSWPCGTGGHGWCWWCRPARWRCTPCSATSTARPCSARRRRVHAGHQGDHAAGDRLSTAVLVVLMAATAAHNPFRPRPGTGFYLHPGADSGGVPGRHRRHPQACVRRVDRGPRRPRSAAPDRRGTPADRA